MKPRIARRTALSALGAGVVMACSSSSGNGENTGSAGASGSGTAGSGTAGSSAGSTNSAGVAGATGGSSAGTGSNSAGSGDNAAGAAAGDTTGNAGAAGGETAGQGGASAGASGSGGAGGASSATCQLFKGWAASGTACMTGVGSYPNPFGLLASSCPTFPEFTLGPCHTTSPERVDISSGLPGIPMRMALRVVDKACKPLSNVIVEVWHTNYKGGYSGNINQICNLDAADKSKDFARGYQRTNSDGVAYFNACFPGWYKGRALHVHVRILTGNYAAADNAPAAVVTQLLWADNFVDGIFTDVPLYAAFGKPDTHLNNDGVVGSAANKSAFLFDTKQMSDGAMLCSKTLIVSS